MNLYSKKNILICMCFPGLIDFSNFKECMARFPMPVNNLDKVPTSEKFILNTPSTSPAEQVC